MARTGSTPTRRQLEVLRLIARGVRAGGPPTFMEMVRALGVRSANTVATHVAALEKKGLVERERLRARSLRVTGLGLAHLGVGGAR